MKTYKIFTNYTDSKFGKSRLEIYCRILQSGLFKILESIEKLILMILRLRLKLHHLFRKTLKVPKTF
ncbi:hypothetical protein LEP1GSC059_2565 [Leptospira noguchii serovar Panama str. CZ214]|uniref:Uncharacterized protein n=1 Tax=Leptospira noguchii serovar Panama str. CZ214 TaxID=1001595 RepID=T0FVP6_9LEPT|nr:hypothetical protein LEP1GSC059_2565 [Leptospira noguchii serovar Panama str. CZ214]